MTSASARTMEQPSVLVLVDRPELATAIASELGPLVGGVTPTVEQARGWLAARGNQPTAATPVVALIAEGSPCDAPDPDPHKGPLTLLDALRHDHPELIGIALASEPRSAPWVEAEARGHLLQVVANPWPPGELRAAALRAGRVAAIDRQRRVLARRLDGRTTLDTITAALPPESSCERLAAALAAEVDQIARCDLAAVLLAPGTPPVLHLHCHRPCPESQLRRVRDRCFELAQQLAGQPLDESQLTVRVTGEPALGGEGGAAATVEAPIQDGGRTLGLLQLCRPADQPFDDADRELLAGLAGRTAPLLRTLVAARDARRQRLAHMVESMADGILLTDLDSDAVTINPAARRMLGISAEQVVTTSFLKEKLGFYPFDLVAARSTGSATSPLREEVRVGDQILHSIVSPVADADGKRVGVVVALRDLTEARQLARRQHEFVSLISHELRTPLTSITGALDILLSGYAGRIADKQHRYLQMARDSAKQLNTLIDDFLDVARSETGSMPMQLTPLALNELGREVTERYRAATRAKQITLRVTTEDTDIRIMGDRDRLTQVLNNLLSNAVKFTPIGGSIDVDIFGPSVAADHVGVSVFNNGEPILEEDRERVFEKFEQLEESTTRRVGGTGLGLAISRAIIEAHHGRIWVEALTDGTKFVFTLPAAPTDQPDLAEPGDEPPAAAELPAIVLIVADDAHSTYILKGILMAAGHEVLLAADADHALNLARTRRPALAVIDAALHDSDCLALVEIFDHDPDTRKTALLVTGDPSDREAALRAGADEHLAKPFEPARFRAACARLITEAGRARAPRILVVDDETSIRTVCRDVLQGAGYQVRTAASGELALGEAKRFRPDLMLVDVMMPGLDGFATAERFRADPTTSMTPIIFVSARGETADKVRAFRIGAEDYVVKPFDAAELVARVGKTLMRHSRELGASPTTQLPGADAIESEIERRLVAGENAAFCYLDLDNLKAFNDYYGYAKADGVIRQTGDLIRQIVAREGTDSDFIGHIAGDDFVFITTAERVDEVCSAILAGFDRLIPLYYNRDDRERGYIETLDRYNQQRRFPIMGVSIAAVTARATALTGFSDLAAAAARGKKLAKQVVGSSYVRDGAVVIGGHDDAAPPAE